MIRKKKNKQLNKAHGKFYKKLLISKARAHSEKVQAELRSLKGDNPRVYWTTLKAATKAKSDCAIPPEEFENHFKELNEKNDLNAETSSHSHTANDLSTPDALSNNEGNVLQTELLNELNKPITMDELSKALKNLKNNKATGPDGIKNEEIKATFELMKNFYLKLFNLIFDSGVFPSSWAEGLIVPIYKKKGSKGDPNNYRGITLLSCLGKYFNLILNARFKKISDILISKIQAGFREGFSTMDHIFALQVIINIYKKSGKPLYIAFVDYQKAFDTVWRDGLWFKLIREGINGKFLNIVKAMYEKSRSCVLINGEKSNFFSSLAGVRQGEILSPLLFAFYINDLECFLKNKEIMPLQHLSATSKIAAEYMGLDDDYIMELLALYYADDTILMAESSKGLQNALDQLFNYCEKWQLKVNEDKTKIICFSNKRKVNVSFLYNEKQLEIVDTFVYLGVTLTRNGIDNKSVEARIAPTNRAIFSTLSMCRANDLPIDLTLDMFHKIIAPCTLYGAEIFGFKNVSKLETLQLKYIKYSLKLKNGTPTCMVYGETGFLPFEYYVKVRMISFWISLIAGRRDKISFKLYVMCLTLYNDGTLTFEWLDCIKSIITECGLNYVFTNQLGYDLKWLQSVFLPKIKSTLKDNILQKWQNDVDTSKKCFYYRHFQSKPKLQKYFLTLPQNAWIPILKFRTSNHRLPIEIYSWKVAFVDRHKRLCTLCNNNDVGDEFHYLIICPMFHEARIQFIPKYFRVRPSVFKFLELINSNEKKTLTNLSKFIKIIFSVFK